MLFKFILQFNYALFIIMKIAARLMSTSVETETEMVDHDKDDDCTYICFTKGKIHPQKLEVLKYNQ